MQIWMTKFICNYLLKNTVNPTLTDIGEVEDHYREDNPILQHDSALLHQEMPVKQFINDTFPKLSILKKSLLFEINKCLLSSLKGHTIKYLYTQTDTTKYNKRAAYVMLKKPRHKEIPKQ